MPWRGRMPGLRLTLGLLGTAAWWGADGACLALAQEAEELFSPAPIASLRPPRPGRTPDAASDPDRPSRVGDEPLPVLRTGVQLVKQGEYAQAISVLEPFRNQEDFMTLHALGVAYLRTHRNGEAYAVLLRAHRLNPGVAGPLLPAALACARMARRCDAYRDLAREYLALGGKFRRLADKIANYQPVTLNQPRRF